MRELENNNYKPIFRSFLKLLPKFKKLQQKRLRNDLNLLRKVSRTYLRLLCFLPFRLHKPQKKTIQTIGEVVAKALRMFTTKNQADKTFGIYDEKGDFYIGDKKVEINGNDFEVKDNVTGVVDKTYIGTPGLWELIVSPKPKDYTKEDYDNYTKLMVKTGALRQKENPNKPKGSKSDKWKY